MNKIYKLKQIETQRLLIRPVQLGDEYPLNKAVNNSLELLQKWQPWAKDPRIEATRDFVQRGVFAWESGSVVDFPMVVIHKEDNKIIAASGYNDRSDVAHALYEIVYWCDVDYQGKGYVTEYANALTRYAFDALGASKVVISMQVENEKSIAVAKRLNFINEGVKDRDPLDCVSDKAEENYIYVVNNADNLPDLKYSWTNIEGDLPVAKIISWAKSSLKITNDKAFSSSKAIVKTPWSNVIEINAGDEIVFLKQTPIDLFLEDEIIKLLCASGIKTIPQIINDNKNEHCFLMTKCGDVTLRDYFDGNLQIDVLKQAIFSYKKLQRSTVKCVDELLSIGVPDWRLDKFPSLYDELIGDTEYLDDNNVTIEQQKQLHQYKDRVKNLCAELATFEITETLNHSDFHDNNILYDRTNKTAAIIDLGETAINNPLFSLHDCIEAVKNRYHLIEDSAEYKLLQQCAFDGFLDDKQKFDRAIEIITLLFPVYLLFAQKRFLDAIHMPFDANDPLSVKQHEKINKGFVWFIKNMEAANAKKELKNQTNQWALNQLASLGFSVTDNDVENILDTPWSYLARYKTSGGLIYLKATPELFFLEPAIIQLLSDKFNASVPVVLAANPELNCFLMQDAGHNLRELLKDNFDESLVLKTIQQFTDLQIAAEDKIDNFFDIGVPDYRLEKLPALYERFVKQRGLLVSEGLSESEIDKLEKLSDTVVKICHELSNYNIKQTIVQPDFNDNNTLVDDARKKITIIDLGEVVISHPFFSLVNFLQQMKKHHGLTESDELYQKLQGACFDKYKGYCANADDFNDALKTAKIASEILGIVYQDRFMQACGKENLKQYNHWKLGDSLRKFMKNNLEFNL